MGFVTLTTLFSLLIVFPIGCSNSKIENWVSIKISQEHIEELQRQVDEGHRPGLLDYSQVAMEFITDENFSVDDSTNLKLIVDEEDRKVIEFTLTDGRFLQLELTQPVKKGSSGIFTVNKYRIIENSTK